MKKYVVLQEEASDCGACCLSSLIKYYQGYVPLEIIRIDTHTTKEGTSFYNLKQAAIKYGFDIVGKKDNLENIATPVIAQVKLTNGMLHFIVIYKIIKKQIICMDPSIGIKKYSNDEFLNIFTNYLLYLKPINKIVKYNKENPLTCFIKIKFIKYKFSYLKIFLITISIIILSIISTFYLNHLLTNLKTKIILILTVIFLVQELITLLKTNMTSILSEKFNKELISNYLNHIFNLPLKYPGELNKRVQELENIKEVFSSILIESLLNIFFIIFSLIILLIINLKLSLIILSVSIIYIIFIIYFYKKIYKNVISLIEEENIYLNYVIEYINKIQNIKLLRITNYINQKLNKILDSKLKNNHNLNKNIGISNFGSSIYTHICILMIFIYSYNFSSQFLIFLFIYQYLSNSLKSLIMRLPETLYFKEVFNRVSSIYYLSKDNLDGSVALNGDLKIIDLNYKIADKVILKNFNLTIKKGLKVLLKGANGSGKTTLLNIIYHNIIDYQGNIYLGNILLNKESFKSLNLSIGFITQNENIFNTTVKENIILDLPYDEKKYQKIINLLYLDDVINNTIYRSETLVNNNFSGGEIQRIILARVLYKDYNILFLDEALNQIDQNLKNKIIINLNNYYQDKTIIYVHHGSDNFNYDLIIDLTARKELYAK